MKDNERKPRNDDHRGEPLYLAGRSFHIEFDDNTEGDYLCIFDGDPRAGRFLDNVGREVILMWHSIWRMYPKEAE